MTPIRNIASNDVRPTVESEDLVLRTARRAYGVPIVMGLIPIIVDLAVLIFYVLRHGWSVVPWSGMAALAALSAFGIAITIGLFAYRIRISANKVEYRDGLFPKTIRIEDIAAIYRGYRNNRPVLLLASRRGSHTDVVIDTLPFAGGELELFIEKLLARMPEDTYVGKMRRDVSCRRRRRKKLKRRPWWFGLLYFPIMCPAVAYVCFIKFQEGLVGFVQLVTMAGGFLTAYIMFSINWIEIRPRGWCGLFADFIYIVHVQPAFAALSVVCFSLSVRKFMPIVAFLGWILGFVVTRPSVRDALETVCSRLFRSGKRGVK